MRFYPSQLKAFLSFLFTISILHASAAQAISKPVELAWKELTTPLVGPEITTTQAAMQFVAQKLPQVLEPLSYPQRIELLSELAIWSLRIRTLRFPDRIENAIIRGETGYNAFFQFLNFKVIETLTPQQTSEAITIMGLMLDIEGELGVPVSTRARETLAAMPNRSLVFDRLNILLLQLIQDVPLPPKPPRNSTDSRRLSLATKVHQFLSANPKPAAPAQAYSSQKTHSRSRLRADHLSQPKPIPKRSRWYCPLWLERLMDSWKNWSGLDNKQIFFSQLSCTLPQS